MDDNFPKTVYQNKLYTLSVFFTFILIKYVLSEKIFMKGKIPAIGGECVIY